MCVCVCVLLTLPNWNFSADDFAVRDERVSLAIVFFYVQMFRSLGLVYDCFEEMINLRSEQIAGT